MDNATTLPAYVDPDPESALYMGIWFTCLAVSGIPLNVFIVVSTLAVKELRSIPANAFIGSLALGDTLFLLSFMLHLPYAVTSNEIICKVTGLGIYTFGLVSTFMPSFLAIHRYTIVYSKHEKLARTLKKVFSKRGIYIITVLTWTYQLSYNSPFIFYDTLGLGPLGTCDVWKRRVEINIPLRVYYIFGVICVLFGSYGVLFFFYLKIATWVRSMTTGMMLTNETRETLEETKNIMRMTKWITIIPLIVTSPTGVVQFGLRINDNFVSMRTGRIFFCLFPFCPMLNAFFTILFVRPYRLALKRFAQKTKLTALAFQYVFERKLIRNTDVTPVMAQPVVTNTNRSVDVERVVCS